MGNEVDRLELQVEAQETKANNQLDKLVGKLDAVANSLSHINTSGLTGLADGVQNFQDTPNGDQILRQRRQIYL